MSLNRWKVLACTLTVGVGGLAVFATPPTDKPKDTDKSEVLPPVLTVKPKSAPNGKDTTAPKGGTQIELDDLPSIPATDTKKPEPASKPAPEKFELEIPLAPPPADKKSEEKADKPAALPPLTEPSPIIPVEATKPAPPKDVPAKSPVDLIPPAPVTIELPPPPKGSPVPVPKPEAVPSPPPSIGNELPTPPPGSLLPPPSPRAPDPLPDAKPKTTAKAGHLKMLVRMGDGQPRFEIRNSATTELLFKVYCDKIEMQGPSDAKSTVAGAAGSGHVRFTAPGIEGTCDQLQILSATGEVLMKGNIRLKSKTGRSWSELTSEKMVYQIGTSGLASAKPTVVPTGFAEK